jgi:hypothetical protein
MKIRYIDTVGIANASIDDTEEFEWEKPLKDSFIIVNNIECF